jgi:hypothetical protein
MKALQVVRIGVGTTPIGAESDQIVMLDFGGGL